MSRWLTVVGIGEDGLDAIAPAARALVDTAEVLVGGARHLALAGAREGVECLTWEAPLYKTIEVIAARRGRRVTVLATGDPMFFGIGVTLAREFGMEETTILPVPGAFSLACARLGWPLAEVVPLTLHGRPLDLLNPHLAPDARLLVLSEDGDTPRQVAERLAALGYGESGMIVLAHLGGPEEGRIEATAAGWGERRAADLNTIAITCRAGPGARVLPTVPGLPDDAFEHDGQITKREVRAVTLAALAPLPGQHLWDVGAGAGSIAIEWMRAARGASSVAIEHHEARAARIARNAASLGVPGLAVVVGEAPAALAGLDAPDAVFIGGGLSAPGMGKHCWAALRPGGRLVANAVTVEGEAAILALGDVTGGDLTRISVARTAAIGTLTGWRPLKTVTQLAATKPRGHDG